MAHDMQVWLATRSCVLLSCQLLHFGLSVIIIGATLYWRFRGILGFYILSIYAHCNLCNVIIEKF